MPLASIERCIHTEFPETGMKLYCFQLHGFAQMLVQQGCHHVLSVTKRLLIFL